jgi:hypothetical protein
MPPSATGLRMFGREAPSNPPLQADVVLASARSHAAEQQGR